MQVFKEEFEANVGKEGRERRKGKKCTDFMLRCFESRSDAFVQTLCVHVCFNMCSCNVSLVLCLWISNTVLQAALITHFKYIKDDVYTAKDTSLNRDLSCCSAMKTKCIISTGFSDITKALCSGFE